MSMTNQEIRRWYNEQVRQIKQLNVQWESDGIVIEERALKAWQIRHNARLAAREKMVDKKEVELLRARDLKLYGNPDGPTYDYLIQEARQLGLVGDHIYQSIIDDATKTNIEVNKRFE